MREHADLKSVLVAVRLRIFLEHYLMLNKLSEKSPSFTILRSFLVVNLRKSPGASQDMNRLRQTDHYRSIACRIVEDSGRGRNGRCQGDHHDRGGSPPVHPGSGGRQSRGRLGVHHMAGGRPPGPGWLEDGDGEDGGG